jgi:hypothetical protein
VNHLHRGARLLVLGLGAALVLAACGGSSAKSGSTTGPTTAVAGGASGSSTAGGPNPNATESAPPGDIPDNQAFVTYAPKGAGYSVQVPEGWAMTRQGTATSFTDKYNGIRIEKRALAAAPTVGSVTSVELPALKAAVSGFVPGRITSVHRSAGTVIRMTYKADSQPNPVTGKVILQDVERYEFWRNGTAVVLTLSASQGSDNVDPWRKVTDSFGWTP